MKFVDLKQGSAEWHAHRAQHNNASDAPAMMGCSPYKTRSDLIREKSTGITPEIDAGTQRRFDDGHRFEALARPMAEEIINDDLSPVTGVNGRMSASFDGLTLDGLIAFEHKSLNNELRAALAEGDAAALPLAYRVQMEQQCMVSGAEKVLFMATKWDGKNLVEALHTWYTPDLDLRAKVIAGWDQFDADVTAYAPETPLIEVTGRAPEALPALRIEVTGMVTASNLDAFKTHAMAVFKGISLELSTDQDFANAEKTVKWCGDVEERLAAAKQHALSQTESIDSLFRAIDDISAEARRVRLDLDKIVKVRKESIRGEIVAGGVSALRDHLAALNERLGKSLMPAVPADFGGAIKGKKNLDSMRDAASTELARAKIEANQVADRIQANLKAFDALDADPLLFPDHAQLVLKAADDFTAAVTSRIAAHKAKEDARLDTERERIRAEETAKLEAQQRAQVQQAAAALVVPQAVARATDPASPSTAGAPDETIKLGEINARIAPLAINADGLAQLGFTTVGTERAAKLYRGSDFDRICTALINHLISIKETA